MTKTLIPAYSWAGDEGAWSIIKAMPVGIAVMNPGNGPGGGRDETVVQRIDEMVALGWECIGYVSTRWMARPFIEITREVTQWRSWYPKVKGIFYDEFIGPETGALEGARLFEDMATRLGGSCVMNCGRSVDPKWWTVLKKAIIVTFENHHELYTLDQAALRPREAHLVYGNDGNSKINAPWGYSTPDVLPNQWDQPNPDWRG